MDQQRRAKLEQKRQLLKLRRQRQAVSAVFRAIARELCPRGVKFLKLTPAANKLALGELRNIPGQDERRPMLQNPLSPSCPLLAPPFSWRDAATG